jgi:Tol biopolymer transport system component
VLAALLIAAAPAHATFPGKNGRIAFQRVPGGSLPRYSASEIYTMNADGSDQRNLTNDPAARDADPLWSPDGTKIAFLRTATDGWYGNNRSEIYVMNADGSNKINLTSKAPISDEGAPLGTKITVNDYSPAWSSDGTQIVFRRNVVVEYELGWVWNPPLFSGIYKMNADGSNQTNIANPPRDVSAPTWSPDGTKIAFNQSGDDAQVVWVMNVDGSQQINLSNNAFPFDDEHPIWSPDGTKIAFTQFIWRRPSQIYVMNADGSNPTNLTNDPSVGEVGPAWSPSGTRIAFQRNFQVYAMNPDGSNKLNLTNDPTLRVTGPVWSPNGTKIAFSRFRPDPDQIYVMNADGSGQTNISNSPTDDFAFDWQPLPGPKRGDYTNAAKFCKAEQDFWGEQFAARYGGGKNAYGKCVSSK